MHDTSSQPPAPFQGTLTACHNQTALAIISSFLAEQLLRVLIVPSRVLRPPPTCRLGTWLIPATILIVPACAARFHFHPRSNLSTLHHQTSALGAHQPHPVRQHWHISELILLRQHTFFSHHPHHSVSPSPATPPQPTRPIIPKTTVPPLFP